MKMYPAVVISEQVGVAVTVAAQFSYLLPLTLPRVGGVIDVAVVHRAADELALELHDGDDAGGIVGGIDIGPVLEIRGIPVASAMRDEQIVVILVDEGEALLYVDEADAAFGGPLQPPP